MSNKTSGKTQRYSKNCFKIRGREQLFIKGQVLVSFAPVPKKKGIQRRSIIPTFNHDRKHYSLAFTLPASTLETDEDLHQDHLRRAKQAEQEISQIMYPKPRSRHKYCGVCRGCYQDYKDHVDSEQHRQCLSRSRFQLLIGQLAAQVQGQRRWQDQRAGESLSEQQLFKCLSTESLQEAGSARKADSGVEA